MNLSLINTAVSSLVFYSNMVLKLDGNSELVANAKRIMGLFVGKKSDL